MPCYKNRIQYNSSYADCRLSGSAWPFRQLCREFYKTNLPWNYLLLDWVQYCKVLWLSRTLYVNKYVAYFQRKIQLPIFFCISGQLTVPTDPDNWSYTVLECWLMHYNALQICDQPSCTCSVQGTLYELFLALHSNTALYYLYVNAINFNVEFCHLLRSEGFPLTGFRNITCKYTKHATHL
jgi:hypothetical protein